MSARRIAAQCRAELLLFVRDRPALALAFVLPVAMLLIFGAAVRLESHDVPLAVVDLDRSALSRGVVADVAATLTLAPRAASPHDADAALAAGRVRGVLTIPPGTARAVRAGRPAALALVVDGSDVVNARLVRADVAGALGARLAGPLDVAVRTWFNPGRAESLFVVPGVYAIVFGIFPALLAAIGTVRDREDGTILQVYASAVSAADYLAGKALAYVALALGEATVLMLTGALVWGLLPVGDPAPLAVSTPLFAAAVVGLGMLVGTRAATQSAAVQAVSTLSTLPAILFTGFLYPLANVPPALRWLADAVPARYFIVVTRDAFVRGGGWPGVWYVPLALLALATVFFALAWRGVRRMQLA